MTRLVLLTVVFLIATSAVTAQGGNQASDEKCDGPVYEAKDLSQKARITARARPPQYTEKARLHSISGQVDLTVVLCRSGQITDIRIVRGLPYGLSESAIRAAKEIKFEPAEKDGDKVSQRMELQFGFNLNPPGSRAPAKEPVEGRNVERTVVRSMTCRFRAEISKEIWTKIKTRVNGPYNKEQGKLDLDAILALGYFDREHSALRLEDGEKGVIYVVFLLKELPQPDVCEK